MHVRHVSFSLLACAVAAACGSSSSSNPNPSADASALEGGSDSSTSDAPVDAKQADAPSDGSSDGANGYDATGADAPASDGVAADATAGDAIVGDAGPDSNEGGPGLEGGSCVVGAGTWDVAAIRIDADKSMSAHAPQIGVDGAGNAIVVYEEQDLPSDQYTVWATIRPAGGVFQVPTALSPIGAFPGDMPPALAVGSDGSALAVWAQPFSTLQSSHYAPGQGWTPEATVSVDAGAVATNTPAVAMDSHGNGIGVWTEDVGAAASAPEAGTQVYVRFYTSGAGWGGATRLSSYGTAVPATSWVAAAASRPSVAIDDAGDAVVAWEASVNATLGHYVGVIAMVRYDGTAKSWGQPVLLPYNNMATVSASLGPSVAIDAHGNGLVVWAGQGPEEGGAGNSLIWASRFVPSTGWSGPENISPVIPFVPYDGGTFMYEQVADPIVAVDRAGSALALWRIGLGVYANRFTAGAWQGPVTLTPNTDATSAGGQPSLAFDSQGNAMSVWQGPKTMQSAWFDAKAGAWQPTTDMLAGELPVVGIPSDCAGAIAIFSDSDGVKALGQH
jgi:hypothetical protein